MLSAPLSPNNWENNCLVCCIHSSLLECLICCVYAAIYRHIPSWTWVESCISLYSFRFIASKYIKCSYQPEIGTIWSLQAREVFVLFSFICCLSLGLPFVEICSWVLKQSVVSKLCFWKSNHEIFYQIASCLIWISFATHWIPACLNHDINR